MLAVCSFCSNPDKTKIDQKVADEVSALLTQYSINWANAIKAKDTTEIAGYFAPGFMYQEGTGERIFRKEFLRGFYDNPTINKTFDLDDVEVTLYGPGLANVTGGSSNVWIDPDGNEQVYKSRFTNVWRKNSGKWQCIIGHGNQLEFGSPETDLAKIKAIPTKAAEAINAGDLDAWLSLVDKNAQALFNNFSTLKGIEEITQEQKKYFGITNSSLAINHYETILLGDFAYGIGTDTGQEKDSKTGKVMKVNDREIVIFKKQNDGEWKVFRLMTNKNK